MPPVFATGYTVGISLAARTSCSPRFRLAVFVQGCFWHGHDCRRGKRPATNTEFWDSKLEGNVIRDQQNVYRLEEAEWDVFTVWECTIERDTKRLLRRLDAIRSLDRFARAGGAA